MKFGKKVFNIGRFVDEFNKQCKVRKVIVVLLLITIGLLSVGGSYALWTYNFTGDSNTIATDSVSLELLESNENIIQVANALPMTDANGIASTEVFDFAVTSKTKRETSIPYTVSIEKITEVSCSDIDSPSLQSNPSCYDFTISTADKNAIIAFIAEFNGFEESVASDYYSALLARNDESMREILLSAGYPEDEVDGYVEEDANGGYLDYYIGIYEEENATEVQMEYEFNGSNTESTNFLLDNQVKVYLTDNKGNKILGPVKISELNDYVIYSGVHEHNSSTAEIKDMFKLRAWIDYSVDASDWTAATDLKYIFRIKVKTVDDATTMVSSEDFQKTLLSGTGYTAASFKTVTFFSEQAVDTSKAEKVFDISANGDSSVVAFVVADEMMPLATGTATKNLFIGTNREILYAPSDLTSMFGEFVNLQSIEVSGLNTSKVTNMERMFYEAGSNASKLVITGIASWDVSSVTNMAGMFYGTSSLTNLDLSGWNPAKVTSADRMFCNSGVTSSTLNKGTKWNTSLDSQIFNCPVN